MALHLSTTQRVSEQLQPLRTTRTLMHRRCSRTERPSFRGRRSARPWHDRCDLARIDAIVLQLDCPWIAGPSRP